MLKMMILSRNIDHKRVRSDIDDLSHDVMSEVNSGRALVITYNLTETYRDAREC
jgi:hypothetical protein